MAFGIRLHCWGDLACFTRPEMKVERVSYDIITPSAARGIVEAIYWKPGIRWVIDRLRVLKPIRFASLRRNEVGKRVPAVAVSRVMGEGHGRLALYVEDERQQRAALLLRDVAYVIEAHFEAIEGERNDAKHLDVFNRRARGGQCFTRPYLGCREFAADFALLEPGVSAPEGHESLEGTRDLGIMLHDLDFENRRRPRFFHATMKNGVVDIPRLSVVRGAA